MTLQDKYAGVIAKANELGVNNLAIAEQNGVLHIAGEANSTADYDALYAVYTTIDPSMGAGDIIMNFDIKAAFGAQLRVTTDSSALNIRSTPSTEGEIVGKAAHDEVITLLEKTDDSWWRVRTTSGTEGFAFTQYLSPL